MSNIDKNINEEIDNALKEAYEYVEMYELKIKNYNNSLLKLDKENNVEYDSLKNDINSQIKKYEKLKKEEEILIEEIKNAWNKTG